MKTPEPNDEAARELWRRRKASAPPNRSDSGADAEALEKLLASPEAADDEAILRLLANDPALLDTVIAAQRAADAPATSVPAEALARARALVRAPERVADSGFAGVRAWLAKQFTVPVAARGLAFTASLALVCAVGFTVGQQNRPATAENFAVVPVELFGGGDALDFGVLFSKGDGR